MPSSKARFHGGIDGWCCLVLHWHHEVDRSLCRGWLGGWVLGGFGRACGIAGNGKEKMRKADFPAQKVVC